MLAKLPQYWKGVIAWIAAIGVVGTQILDATLADGVWSKEDTITAVIVLGGAFGVVAKQAPGYVAPADTLGGRHTRPAGDAGVINWVALACIAIVIAAIVIVISLVDVNVK